MKESIEGKRVYRGLTTINITPPNPFFIFSLSVALSGKEMFIGIEDVCRQMFARCLKANSQSPPLSSLLLPVLIGQIS